MRHYKIIFLVALIYLETACAPSSRKIENCLPVKNPKLFVYDYGRVIGEFSMDNDKSLNLILKELSKGWEFTLVTYAPHKYWITGDNLSLMIWQDRIIGSFRRDNTGDWTGGIRYITMDEYSRLISVISKYDKSTPGSNYNSEFNSIKSLPNNWMHPRP